MKYLMKDVKIFEGTNSRGKFHWLQATLFNDKNIRMNGEVRQYWSTSEEECKIYLDSGVCTQNQQESTKDVIVFDVNDASLKEAIAPGGKLSEYSHLDLRHINAVKVVWPLTGVWAQIYRNDVIKDGVLVHKKGDVRTTETGQIMEFRELSFYLATDIDEDTGNRIYSQDPQRVANRILERGYIKLNTESNATPQVAAPELDVTPEIAEPATSEKSLEELKAEIKRLESQKA